MKNSDKPPVDLTGLKNSTCSVDGGCGGKGMCPGQALLLSILAGTGLGSLTGLTWMTPVVAIVLGFILITGIWRRLFSGFKSLK
jgi:hypothetical protein